MDANHPVAQHFATRLNDSETIYRLKPDERSRYEAVRTQALMVQWEIPIPFTPF